MITTIAPTGTTIPGVEHHLVETNGTTLHVVSAGDQGAPILLVHGFPESWWAFHKLIPILAKKHQVFAVDLRGFGDSATAEVGFSSTVAAEDLHALIRTLNLGAVHVAGQDIAGGTIYRLATDHPEDVLSVIGIEMGLAGFGLEGLADVTHGGSWHIGVLAAPGKAEMLFTGREIDLLGTWAFPSMTGVQGSINDDDIREFARSYSRVDGWNGAVGLYQSMLAEGEEFRAQATKPLPLPVLAIGGFGGAFTANTLSKVVEGPVTAVELDGVGHYVAMEAPVRLATEIMDFLSA